ncbi:hypothetical protein [Brevundimonas lenta]|uniref:Uncharacterized protein n=1 Tax=Brevundimonas lenta TaxID=424796 RepID=A0A7W6NQ49_9CAUL|nr:hypothetical protein [Brevundimonas lenta]MBB4082835.1 hypothetical protein [Brevundimonas lenta]
MKLSKSGLATLAASITFLVAAPAFEAADAQVRGGGRGGVSRGGGGGHGGMSRGGGGGRSAASRPARSPSAGTAQRARPSGGQSRPAAAAGTRDRGGAGAAARERPGGAGAGTRERPAAGDRTPNRDRPGGDGNRINSGDGNRINTGDREVNRGDRVRDRETNIDRGDININNDIDIDGDHGWDWDDGWGDHPIAAGVAFGTAAAWTSAVVGSMFYSIPPACSPYYGSYYYCDGHYYQPQYQGDTVVYVVVDDPAQSVTVVQ